MRLRNSMPPANTLRLARVLLVLASIGALISFAGGFATVGDAGAGMKITAVHDLLGFLVYAAVFALLAWKPRALPGLWEIVILQKAAMSVLAFTAFRDADGALLTATVDTVLTIVLLAAYLLTRAWETWNAPTRSHAA